MRPAGSTLKPPSGLRETDIFGGLIFYFHYSLQFAESTMKSHPDEAVLPQAVEKDSEEQIKLFKKELNDFNSRYTPVISVASFDSNNGRFYPSIYISINIVVNITPGVYSDSEI